MEIRFDNQVVMVTGASTGIGAALARAFGAAGARVVVHYNASGDAAKAVLKDIQSGGGTGLLVKADVTKPAQIRSMVAKVLDHWGGVDVLVNNAGGLIERSPLHEMSEETYQYIMDLNVASVFRICQLVLPVMLRQGHGNIVNVSSVAARNGGGVNSMVYAASKGAVSSLTRGLAKNLAAQNIRVNALSPGIILTPFHDRWTPPDQLQAIIKTVPMQRGGRAEECVGTVFFLASDALSSYVTGQVIEVNGGMLMP